MEMLRLIAQHLHLNPAYGIVAFYRSAQIFSYSSRF